MAHHEKPPTNSSDPYQPLVRTEHDLAGGHPGTDLMRLGPYDGPVFSRTPAVVNGSMDTKWFLHSLRRRWLLATLMGLLLGSAAGVGLYIAFPESSSATAVFRVKSDQDIVLQKMPEQAAANYEIFKATQMASVKNHSVLSYAKDDASLRDVEVLLKAPDPVVWLEENINVSFNNQSEYMLISLRLDEKAEDLKKIVNAVARAYAEQVVEKEKKSRRLVRDALVIQHEEAEKDLLEQWAEYRVKLEEQGAFEGEKDPQVELLLAKITWLENRKIQLEANLRGLQKQKIYNETLRRSPAYVDYQVQAALASDIDSQMLRSEMTQLRYQLRRALEQSKNRPTRTTQRLEEKIASLQQQENALAQQIRQQIESSSGSKPSLEKVSFDLNYNIAAGSALQELKKLNEEELPAAYEDLRKQSQRSTDLMLRKSRIDQLTDVAADMQSRIAAWDVELSAPARIVWEGEDAYTTPGINKAQRYTIAGLGGIATTVLVGLGIAYMEFLGRRLNGPYQIDEGLGIRVVGTLPSLDARKMTNSRHVAQLSESIDSVRTALMHESTSKARQVVLVTSPCAMEGRTIVASQLAASLARAGRRTLLIDGDLRRPAMHTLFGVPLEDGLCEVLRAEAEVTDVVRPTQAEGLWLMTAGYCDADAVHAMATDQIQPIFEKLRADYDFVIIDGAPVLGLSDSLMIGQHCDGVLLSVLRDRTSVPKTYQAAELLRSVGIRLIGSVVNGVSTSADRRVTHLQVAAPKSSRKQLEAATADKS
jgi:succinoglycan biosynthesis transport protein ExoP